MRAVSTGRAAVAALSIGVLICLLAASGQAGLVGYWSFDNPANLGQDSSGLGNDLIAVGAPGFDPAGVFGGAVSVDGSSYFVRDVFNDGTPTGLGFPAGVPVANQAYTISAWVQPSGALGSGGIVGWGNYGSNSQVNAFRFRSTNGLHNYWWANDLGLDNVGVATLNDGQWHHVVATYTGTDQRIYVNDQLVAQRTATGHNTGAQKFSVGATLVNRPGGGNPEIFPAGKLDEVAVWNEGLSHKQVADLFAGMSPNNLILQNWDFEDGLLPAGWVAVGNAFIGQPTNSNRSGFFAATKSGDWFIGTHEDGRGDGATGTLTSPGFTLEGNTIRALIGGGNHTTTQLRLEREVSPGTWQIVRRESGHATTLSAAEGEPLREYRWNVHDLVGQTVRFQIVDQHTGGWGHINVDNIRVLNEFRPQELHTDFGGGTLHPDLIVYRPEGNPSVGPTGDGKLRFALNGTFDHWATVNNMPQLRLNVATSDAPEFILETHLTGRTGSLGDTHTGLMLVFEDRATGQHDAVAFGPYATSGIRAEGPFFGDGDEFGTTPIHHYAAALSGTITDVYLRIDRDGPTYDFLYRESLDAPWTSLATRTNAEGKELLYAGLFAKSWASRNFAVEFDYLTFINVPEPGTAALLVLGFPGLVLTSGRRRRQSTRRG